MLAVMDPPPRRWLVALATASSVAICVVVPLVLAIGAARDRGEVRHLPAGTVLMPNVTGLPLVQANSVLRSAGLTIDTQLLRAQASLRAGRGAVLAQNPEPRSVIVAGDARIALTVSAGADPKRSRNNLVMVGGTCDVMPSPPSPCVGGILLVPPIRPSSAGA